MLKKLTITENSALYSCSLIEKDLKQRGDGFSVRFQIQSFQAHRITNSRSKLARQSLETRAVKLDTSFQRAWHPNIWDHMGKPYAFWCKSLSKGLKKRWNAGLINVFLLKKNRIIVDIKARFQCELHRHYDSPTVKRLTNHSLRLLCRTLQNWVPLHCNMTIPFWETKITLYAFV